MNDSKPLAKYVLNSSTAKAHAPATAGLAFRDPDSGKFRDPRSDSAVEPSGTAGREAAAERPLVPKEPAIAFVLVSPFHPLIPFFLCCVHHCELLLRDARVAAFG